MMTDSGGPSSASTLTLEQRDRFFILAPDLACVADLEGNFVKLNPAWEATLGYRVDELEGVRFLDLIHPDDLKATEDALGILAAGNAVQNFTNRYRHKDGSYRWIEWHSVADDQGLAYAMARDVTAKVEIEEALRRSEERLRAVSEAIPDLLFIIDSEGRYLDVIASEPTRRYPSAHELKGRCLEDVFAPAEAVRLLDAIRASLRDGLLKLVEYELDTIDGRRWFEGRITPLRVPIGGAPAVLFLARDVTDKKLTEIELARSNEELQQFAYVASHDLKEPLRMISSYLRLIEQRYGERLDDDGMEFLDFATDGAARMSDLIDALLEYSRVGTRARGFESTDCNRVVEKVVRDLEPAILERAARVEIGELPEVEGDEIQLGQLFRNLIGNAVKFSPNGSGEINVDAEDKGDHWLFAVRDNGIGIEAKFLECVFEIFRRLNGRSEYDGTGIGLAVCRKIVDRHDGRIWVESEPGAGSTFFFTIPKRKGA